MFAVTPIDNCPHIAEFVRTDGWLANVSCSAPCGDCGSTKENWVCLACGYVACSRYVEGHMQEHAQATQHRILLSFTDLSVWCNACDSYIKSPELAEVLIAVHRAKFGGVPPDLAKVAELKEHVDKAIDEAAGREQ